jgi:hypothetical protein
MRRAADVTHARTESTKSHARTESQKSRITRASRGQSMDEGQPSWPLRDELLAGTAAEEEVRAGPRCSLAL